MSRPEATPSGRTQRTVRARLIRPIGVAGVVLSLLGFLNIGTPGVVRPERAVAYTVLLAGMALACAVIAIAPRRASWVIEPALLAANVVYAMSVLAVTRPALQASVALLCLPLLLAGLVLSRRLLVLDCLLVTACVFLAVSRMDPRGGTELMMLGAIYSLSLLLVPWVVFSLRTRVEALIDRLHEESVTDTLTELRNRRYLEERAPGLIEAARAGGGQVMAAMIDLDDFKAINDRHGHLTGDEILRRVGALIRSITPAEAIAVRLGGEEFAVLGPVPNAAAAHEIGDRLHAQVASAGGPVPVTCSIGIATRPARDGDDREFLWHLIDLADDALYAAKHAGKNQVQPERPRG